MNDHPPRPKLEILPFPIAMHGIPMDVSAVSLSRGGRGCEYRVGLLLRPAGAEDDLALQFFLDLDDAAFLRDALDEILKAHQARQQAAN